MFEKSENPTAVEKAAEQPIIPTPEQAALVREMKQLLLRNVDHMLATGDFSPQEKLVDRAEYLVSHYPNYSKIYMYHVLGSSTPQEGQVFDAFDFPGEDSVVKFINEEIAPLSEKKAAASAE